MIERLLPFGATILARTLRFRWSGETLPERSIVMFWHGKMLAGWYAVRTRAPVALVSRSKDGQLLSSVLVRWGYQLARGSTGKRGREALDVAIRMLNEGEADTLAITPDGPRGPRHIFKRGAFIAAREADVPLYMLTIRYRWRTVLTKSWDRFEVPLPFSRVEIQVDRVPATNELDDATLERASLSFAE
ncbi:MAG: DUF374 domain-containing protein [Bacteroidota bacterium]|nr:DUF374 domain-containing protein [Bacteroidota bacterium]MDP4231765.1 DUF374 domain-containing protein [Bacteroidota bacterium]MDP4243501.1 DUF374 domain-containing protein [Bacteroidota bacterium]MDP4287102.1 DUF374 domain-containing protein [Bacteroidota bacterium]